MSNMKKTVIDFVHEKDTKGTYRYQENSDDDPIIGTLYIKKKAAGPNAPSGFRVTLEPIYD